MIRTCLSGEPLNIWLPGDAGKVVALRSGLAVVCGVGAVLSFRRMHRFSAVFSMQS
jgi:hypothetical protein